MNHKRWAPSSLLLAPAGSAEERHRPWPLGYPGRSPKNATLSSSASPLPFPQQDVKEFEPKEYILLWRNFAKLHNATSLKTDHFAKTVHTVDTTRGNETFSCKEARKGDEGANSNQKYPLGDVPPLQRDPEKGMSFRKINRRLLLSDASQLFKTVPEVQHCSRKTERKELQADRVHARAQLEVAASWTCVSVLCSRQKPPGP